MQHCTKLSLLFLSLVAAAAQAQPSPAASVPAAGASAPEAVPTARIDMRSCQRPDYPARAVRAGETGTTRLQFHVSAEGRVLRTEVLRSSGSQALDDAAVEALSKCRFQAGQVDGKAVQSTARVEYVWRLEGDPHLPLTLGPNMSYCPLPTEPEGEPARAAIVTTRVRLNFLRNGRVDSASIETSSGSASLDKAALEAYRRCYFNSSVLVAFAFVSSAVLDHVWPASARAH